MTPKKVCLAPQKNPSSVMKTRHRNQIRNCGPEEENPTNLSRLSLPDVIID